MLKSDCRQCGECCIKRVCTPTPDEIKRIAAFLELPILEAIKKYFAIDQLDDDPTLFLRPLAKNILDLGGKFIPNYKTFNEGECIFLTKNNICSIHEVKPKIGLLHKCWEEDDEEFHPIEE